MPKLPWKTLIGELVERVISKAKHLSSRKVKTKNPYIDDAGTIFFLKKLNVYCTSKGYLLLNSSIFASYF